MKCTHMHPSAWLHFVLFTTGIALVAPAALGQPFSYEVTPVATDPTSFLTQANSEGARRFVLDSFETFGSVYVKDASRSATFTYELLAPVTTVGQMQAQANAQGARGYMGAGFTVLGNLYYKDSSKAATLTYALAEVCDADVLISSDADLLAMHPWRGVPILTPAAFVALGNS